VLTATNGYHDEKWDIMMKNGSMTFLYSTLCGTCNRSSLYYDTSMSHSPSQVFFDVPHVEQNWLRLCASGLKAQQTKSKIDVGNLD
jgi:hypothetical protein